MSTGALAGDWHRNTLSAIAQITGVAERGVALIVHLGDFGTWPGTAGRFYLDRVVRATLRSGAATLGMTPTSGSSYADPLTVERFADLWTRFSRFRREDLPKRFSARFASSCPMS